MFKKILINNKNLFIKLMLCTCIVSFTPAFAKRIPEQTDKRIPWMKVKKETTFPQKQMPQASAIKKPVITRQQVVIPEDEKLFKQAFDKLKAGQYQASLHDYQLLLKQYPNSQCIENSHYWIAEGQRLSGHYETALNKYLYILRYYPNSQNAEKSKLRMAQAYGQMGKWTKAKNIYQKIITKQPGSIAAEEAQTRLNFIRLKGYQ